MLSYFYTRNMPVFSRNAVCGLKTMSSFTRKFVVNFVYKSYKSQSNIKDITYSSVAQGKVVVMNPKC